MARTGYDHVVRQGTRSSVTMDPRLIQEDLSKRIRELHPEATPFMTLSEHVLRGQKPGNHKVEMKVFHHFDPYDVTSQARMGTAGNNETRFAALKMEQVGRKTGKGDMYYQPQDYLYVIETGQEVMVVANDQNAYQTPNGPWQFSTTLTGTASTTLTQPGWVIVRNIKDQPLLPITTSDTIFVGRKIYEGQDWTAPPRHRDVLYDYNLVMHMDTLLKFTRDQIELVKKKDGFNDLENQKRLEIVEFKQAVERAHFLSTRHFEGNYTNQINRSMGGMLDMVRTNVTHYNPDSVSDWEDLLTYHMDYTAFRYNPNGFQKLALPGPDIYHQLLKIWKPYRRTNLNSKSKVMPGGLNFDMYDFGKFKLKIARNDCFRQGTRFGWLMPILDLKEIVCRTALDFETEETTLANQRIRSFGCEWQGTVEWNVEQSHSLLMV